MSTLMQLKMNVLGMIDVIAGLFLALLSLAIIVTSIKFYKSKVTQSGCDGISEASPPSDTQLQTSRSLSHCRSPGCYRCSNNQGTMHTALTRLSYYAHGSTVTDGTADFQNISADIKKSLERLKHPDKYSGDVFGSSPVVFKMSGLREEILWSVNDFPALQLLETQYRQIQTEFLNLYRSPLPETKCLWKVNSTDAGQWEIAQLFDQGRKTKAAELCPLTMEILKKIPYVISGNIFGDVSFSVVHPGTHIATHSGSTNCRIRCHLGLKVPGDICTLCVGNQICHWQEGKVLCFNDAFPHSVEHTGAEGSSFRAVFMLDLWHPDITKSQKDILNYTFSA